MDVTNLKAMTVQTAIVNKVLNRAVDEYTQERPPREVKLRPSSMPTCSVWLARDLFASMRDPTAPEVVAFLSDFYFSIGTATHEWIQRWLGPSNQVLGNYKCTECGHEALVSTDSWCPTCESQMEYHELEVKYRGLTGHIDGVFVVQRKRGYVVCDYKTSSWRAANKKSQANSPDPQHFIQLGTYAFVLRETMDMDIDSISIVYVCRDNPNQRTEFNIEYTDELHEEFREFVNAQSRGWKAAKNFVADPCDETIDDVIKYKTCADIDAYERLILPCHHYDNGCPYAQDCFGGDIRRKFVQEIKLIKDAIPLKTEK